MASLERQHAIIAKSLDPNRCWVDDALALVGPGGRQSQLYHLSDAVPGSSEHDELDGQ